MANPGQGETFEFFGLLWDVDAAWRLVADREPNGRVPIEPLFERLGSIVRVNHAHAMSDAVDPRVPVLVVPVPVVGGQIVIDGWHRMAKALWVAGATHMPAHVLSAEEERQIRLRGGEAAA